MSRRNTILAVVIAGALAAAGLHTTEAVAGPGAGKSKVVQKQSHKEVRYKRANRRTVGFRRVLKDKRVTLRPGETSVNIRTRLMDGVMVKNKIGEWKVAPIHLSAAKGSLLYRVTPQMKSVKLLDYGVGGLFRRTTPRQVVEVPIVVER